MPANARAPSGCWSRGSPALWASSIHPGWPRSNSRLNRKKTGPGAEGRPFGLVAAAAGSAGGLEQEPVPLFGLINEVFQDGSRRDIVMLIGDLMGRAHALDHLLGVTHQFGEHVGRRNEILVIVLDGLKPGDLTDGMDGAGADLAHPLRQFI